MPAISFSTMKNKILNGKKKQTIRLLRTNYWLKFKKGDKLIGYWKMRTKEREKLFESELSQNPFVLKMVDFDENLMILDGFKGLQDGMENWFFPHYGDDLNLRFVVLRWK